MTTSPTNEAELLERLQARDIRTVRFLYCDPSGVIRGKSVHAGRMAGKLTEGIGLTRAQNAVNLLEDLVNIPGMEPIGEIRLIPDLSSYSELPWLPRSAAMLVDQVDHDMTDWGCCPRQFLKRVIAQAADAGIAVFASVEPEFYLADRDEAGNPRPWADAGVYSSAGLDRGAAVMGDIVDALTARGLVVEQVLNEYGPGQQEISIRYADALTAADNHLIFRDTVRGVAEVTHGLLASFGPKPFADGIGSGAHVHFSLWSLDGRTNLMHDPTTPGQIAAGARSFLAGVLAHLPALIALTCPSYLSYERLQPSSWAGSTVSWGYDNREAALRIASPFRGREAESINAELKAVDGSANPHLAIGGIILAGLDGMARGLELPQPATLDPARMSTAERAACGIAPLPGNQIEALDNLAADQVLTEGLGPLLSRCIQAVRRAEAERSSMLGADRVRRLTFSSY